MENKKIVETKEYPALILLESKIKAESERLLRKNTFILKLLNEIGGYLDKEFSPLKEFDIEAHLEILTDLFNAFVPLCNNKMEKRIPLHLIFILLGQIDDLHQHFENLINYSKQILMSENYLKIQQSIFDEILNNELKYCLNEEQCVFALNYSKKFVGDILIFLDIISYCFHDDEDRHLLKQVLEDLGEKYEKVIIPKSILSSIVIEEDNYYGLLNQLLELDYEKVNDVGILIFEDMKFQIKVPSINELAEYFKSNSENKKKNQNKKKKLTKKNSKEQNDGINKQNQDSSNVIPSNVQKPENTVSVNIDITKFTEVERYLYDELKCVKNDLKIVKKQNVDMKVTMNAMKLELKKIKIRSLYKGIIDIFCHVYNVNLNNNYYNKLNDLLYEFDIRYEENPKIKELKNFLYDVYYYLQKGNVLAHSIKEDITPLEMIFSSIEKENKKDYDNTKKILSSLSFNDTLNQVLNKYYSLKDKKKLIKNINFSLKNLEEKLL